MRVVLERSRFDTAPGEQVDVELDVVNTGRLIDGVTARVIGLDPTSVTSRPPLLPLFPEATGRLALSLGLPPTFPAGRHPLTVELSSSIEGEPPAHADIDLVVAARPRLQLVVLPPVRRSHRRGRYLLECRNHGNVPLPLVLLPDDGDAGLRATVTPQVLTVEPGATAAAVLTLRAPLRLLGNDADRPLRVRALSDELEVEADALAVLRQRPLLPRGVLTLLVLLLVLGLWASAFLVGLGRVFSGDPLTKSAPASFYVTASPDGLREVASSAPDGSLPKTGALPPGTGGGVAGTVRAASTGAGLGRVVVEALRQTRDGPVLAVSAATAADGSYALLGLLPGDYLLRAGGPGLVPAYFPGGVPEARAGAVRAAAQQLRNGVDLTVEGLPASISGRVDPGDVTTPVATEVVARALDGSDTRELARTTTDAQGRFTLRGLPSPGRYELGFLAAGYAPTTTVETVGPGQARSVPTVRLASDAGSVSGQVLQDDGRGGAVPLGGVTVSTSVDGREVTTTTPTTGAVGRFVLEGLPTPGTYVVTFTRPGGGATTRSVDLPAGRSTSLEVRLRPGSGTVTGTVRQGGPDGPGLGGVTVTVGGAPTPLSATTVTDGEVGTYSVSGLPVPGSYTLTFAREGLAPQTVPVRLTAQAPSGVVDGALAPSTGTLVGRVLGELRDGRRTPVAEATLTLTDGAVVRTATAVSAGAGGAGSFRFTGLPPATYALTVTAPGRQQQTAQVEVVAATTTCQDLYAVAPGEPLDEDPPPCTRP